MIFFMIINVMGPLQHGMVNFKRTNRIDCVICIGLIILLNTFNVSSQQSSSFTRNEDFVRVEAVIPRDSLHIATYAIKHCNIENLEQILNEVSDPEHSSYGNHLSREQVHQLVKNDEGLNSLLSYFELHNVEVVKKSLYGEFVTARTTIAKWEKLLSTKFFTYKRLADQNTTIYRADNYNLDESLQSHVSAVFGVTHFPFPKSSTKPIHTMSTASSDKSSSVITDFITPNTLNGFYNVFSNVGTRKISQTIYSSDYQYFSSSDLAAFQAQYGIPNHPVDSDPNHRNSPYMCSYSPNYCVESNLDLQYITAIGQNTNTTIIYDDIGDIFLSWITAVANTMSPSKVYSISYGIQESAIDYYGYDAYVDAFNIQAMILGVMGTTIVVASGDDGAPGYYARYDTYGCGYDPSFPATSPYVLAVGATMGVESGTAEVTCDWKLGGVITSGGGFSILSDRPAYQKRAVKQYFASLKKSPKSGYNAHGRGIPDISLSGKYYAIIIGGATYYVSGTSASAPSVAGMISLINAARIKKGKSSLGWLNPILYAYNGSFTNDITSGSNECAIGACCSEGFNTSVGWDPVTGFGSLDYGKFYDAMLGVKSGLTRSPVLKPTRAPTMLSLQNSIMCDLVGAISPFTSGYTGWTCDTSHLPTTDLCSTWDGVTCSSTIVTSIKLSYLTGGSLPTTLGILNQITQLTISNSNLRGNIPTSITYMTKLTSLNLISNQLSGTLPSILSTLTNLISLTLSYNKFSGTFPTSLMNLNALQFLYLRSNNLYGKMPTLTYSLFQSLEYLELSENSLTGTIPSSGYYYGLESLSLHKNSLTGSVPTVFCTQYYLNYLDFYKNPLTCYPSCLSYGYFTVNAGKIPMCGGGNNNNNDDYNGYYSYYYNSNSTMTPSDDHWNEYGYTPTTSSHSHSSITGGQIGGAVVGSLVGMALIIGIILYFVYPGWFARRSRGNSTENQSPVEIAPSNIQHFDMEENRQRDFANSLAAQQAGGVTNVDTTNILHTGGSYESKEDNSVVEASESISTPVAMDNNQTSNDESNTAISSEETKEEVISDSNATVLEEGTGYVDDPPNPSPAIDIDRSSI